MIAKIDLIVDQEYELRDLFGMVSHTWKYVGKARILGTSTSTWEYPPNGSIKLIFEKDGCYCFGECAITIDPFSHSLIVDITAKKTCSSFEELSYVIETKCRLISD